MRDPPAIGAAMDRGDEQWWERRGYALLLVLMTAVPLLWPTTPPLTDLPGHMGRYAVQLGIADSPFLHQWFSFRWGLIGNLGVDLLMEPLGRLLGVEAAVKLIVILMPMTMVAGLLWIAHEVHGRLPPTAAFALPLAYCFPFQFGFVNFSLSMALALVAFALWIRLGRLGRLRLRAALFVPIGIGIWIAHTYGWGLLGLLAFAAEVSRNRQHRLGAIWRGALACLPLAPPVLLMVAWRSDGVAGETSDWFNWLSKVDSLKGILRERSRAFDRTSADILYFIIIAGVIGLSMDAMLAGAALLLLAIFVLLPRILLGSAFADMRLAAYMVAIAVIAISGRRLSPSFRRVVAAIALLFFVVRLGATTIDFIEKDRDYRAQLAAVDHIPRGARVMTLVDLPCEGSWAPTKLDHIGDLAIVRRHAFVNGQWEMPGAQLLRVEYDRVVGPYAADPSQILRPRLCRPRYLRSYQATLAGFPRQHFDYLWLINMAPDRWPSGDKGLVRVWGASRGALYRIVSTTTASETPKGTERLPTQ
jgi:hypothetical protein